ncbi:low choriolytic enzyme isoform X2 [Cyclopterus lumpus]|uniref:low choriolytic enzyme isoform X2 n=1 Tax=Cyclopterus lumpus TaxID=8103 RepID=UPI0014873A35|nr:low choriolytic enzyme isoform X2 [Cyclopterus lumpus]
MLQLVLAALLLVEAAQLVACSPVPGASQQDDIIELVKYLDSNPETLEELLAKDHAVLEGDLVLSSDRNAVSRVWPTSVIPYVIGPDLAAKRQEIVSAMAMVSEHTCMSFPERTYEADYLHFMHSKGCASFVGYHGGKQSMFIGPKCIVGNIVHEILHALGFYHEHTRMDREQYIKILPNNIMAGMERNFKIQDGVTFDLRYDVKSILHYGSDFFSANGRPTIVANTATAEMGQRVKMTETDIKRVGILYHCDSPKSWMRDIPVNNTAEEEQTPAPSSWVTLQQLNNATRGQNGTSSGMDQSNY